MSVGHGIAYIFGVIGVVLFVQLIPKFSKADMEEERRKLIIADDGSSKKKNGVKKLIDMDPFGIMVFALAAIIGIFVGMIKIPRCPLTDFQELHSRLQQRADAC